MQQDKPRSKRRRDETTLKRERNRHWWILVCQGYSFREIGDRYGVCYRTVHYNVNQIPERDRMEIRETLMRGVA